MEVAETEEDIEAAVALMLGVGNPEEVIEEA